MTTDGIAHRILGQSLTLPCGAVLKNRIAKSAISDSLGDGRGSPTAEQARLYQRWANGGVAAAIVGEVQPTPDFPEKPGNLVLDPEADEEPFRTLAQRGSANGARLWLQLGHAGALAHAPLSRPAGPSALDIGDLRCSAMTLEDIEALPRQFARAAKRAQSLGFGGVQIHAAHGFLLSQFLSPLFNRRTDIYGGSMAARCRLVVDVVSEVRETVGPAYPIALKINATDNLEGGLTEDDAFLALEILDGTSLDLIDISGGTYFPGARAISDGGGGKGPYFLGFAARARRATSKPLMVTGGFKTRRQAAEAIASGQADMIGLARALALDPDLPRKWLLPAGGDPQFPRFADPPPGSVTAWYTMRLTAMAEDRETAFAMEMPEAVAAYEARDAARALAWRDRFQDPVGH